MTGQDDPSGCEPGNDEPSRPGVPADAVVLVEDETADPSADSLCEQLLAVLRGQPLIIWQEEEGR